MVTLVFALLSGIFALIAVLANVFEKNSTDTAITENNAVKAQLNGLNTQIQANQQQITAEQQNLAKEQTNETNQSVLNSINNPPKS